jgi:hypothetical protein
VFRFLVRDENLQVVKVALAVVAPWSLELLIQVWVSLAFLRHLCGREGCGRELVEDVVVPEVLRA